MSNVCTLWLRTVVKHTFTSNQYNAKWTPSLNTLVGNPWDSLSKLFAEIKILRVNIYLYAKSISYQSVGIHTLVVTDKHEICETDRDFISTSSSPGAVTRRITQPLHGSWFPTEPTDRDWMPFNAKSDVLDVAYATDGITLPMDFDLFFDVHCRLRGLKHPATVTDCRDTLAVSTAAMVLDSGSPNPVSPSQHPGLPSDTG